MKTKNCRRCLKIKKKIVSIFDESLNQSHEQNKLTAELVCRLTAISEILEKEELGLDTQTRFSKKATDSSRCRLILNRKSFINVEENRKNMQNLKEMANHSLITSHQKKIFSFERRDAQECRFSCQTNVFKRVGN